LQPTATLKSRTRRAEMGVRGLSLEGGRRGQEASASASRRPSAGTGDDAALAAAGSSGTTAEMPALTPSLVPSVGVLSWGISRTEFENAGAAIVFANADDLLVHIEENPIARLATRHRVAVRSCASSWTGHTRPSE